MSTKKLDPRVIHIRKLIRENHFVPNVDWHCSDYNSQHPQRSFFHPATRVTLIEIRIPYKCGNDVYKYLFRDRNEEMIFNVIWSNSFIDNKHIERVFKEKMDTITKIWFKE